MRAWFVFLFLFIFLFASRASAQSVFSDAQVQAPQLGAPERGSLAGQLASVAFGPADVSRGGFSLPSPMGAPGERGALPASPLPTYSPENGASEWGLGWQTQIVITRGRVAGDIDYATDDLLGPWGRMVRGTDGAYYPVGLREHVRVQVVGATLVARTPDGARWTFGGTKVTANARGTYAWYLTDVVTVTGQAAHYDYVGNASGRLFVATVSYGGRAGAPQYQLTFDYEGVSTTLVEYKSGAPLSLDRRVVAVHALVRSPASSITWTERYAHLLDYQSDTYGPAFYLSHVRKRFPSGELAPAFHYTYRLTGDALSGAVARPSPKLEQLVATGDIDFVQAHRAASLDSDDDGRPDLERATDMALFVQSDSSFAVQPLAPPDPTINPLCRPSVADTNAPRTLARMRTTEPAYHVVATQASSDNLRTQVVICDRAGHAIHSEWIAGAWSKENGAKLVDLNRDHQPDFVRVDQGSFAILPNASTANGFVFAGAKTGQLTPVFTPSATWLHDMNGDGIADLVARSSSELVFWYGKGNYQYEPNGVVLAFFTSSGQLGDLAPFEVTFLDMNKDGLTDVLLGDDTGVTLFVNSGTAFTSVDVPALQQITRRPVPLDVPGSGNIELAYVGGDGHGYSVALSDAAAALMISADDGKGSVLTFGYGRAPAAPGVHQRSALLSTLSVQSTGYDTVTYGYFYDGAVLHSAGKFLVGYGSVIRHAPVDSATMTFFNDDHVSGVRLTSVEHDELTPGVEKVAFDTYDDAALAGVPWKRLRTEAKGWRSTDAGHPASFVATTEYLAYNADVCPIQVRATSSAGVLLRQTTLATVAGFTGSLACLDQRVVVTGTHADASLDFRHEWSVDRDGAGQVLKVSSFDRSAKAVVLQSNTYTADERLATMSTPGRGTSTFNYDPVTRLLTSVTAADGTVTAAVDVNPLTDALRALVVHHGDLAYRRDFQFDAQERLAATWTDLGHASATIPNARYTYRYASGTMPGLVGIDELATAPANATGAQATYRHKRELATAAGEALASATLIPEGWTFGGVTSRSRTTRTTTAMQRATSTVDVGMLSVAALLTGDSATGYAQASLFGGTARSATKMHADVERDVAETLDLPGYLRKTSTENNQYKTVTLEDAAGHAVQITDPAGASWRYAYDALGRVRTVTLPDGAAHKVAFDDFARVTHIARDGVGTVDYAYDATTGLLTRRTLKGTDGTSGRRLDYAYDAVGRVVKETHTDLVSAATQAFTFYFDGATPANPAVTTTRRGLLTGVAGNGFTKTFDHRADGQIVHRQLTLTGFRTLDETLTYDEDGAVASRMLALKDATGALVSQSVEATQRDAYGRPSGTTMNGHPFATYAYDANGFVASAQLLAPYGHGESVTLPRDPLTRARTGLTQKTATWTTAFTRRLNNRAMADYDDLQAGVDKRHRLYQYGAQGYLLGSSDAVEQYGYGFDVAGLPTHIGHTKGGVVVESADAVKSGAVLTVGPHHHKLDTQGRAIERDGVTMTYGPDGQIATATNGARTWSYLYDEAGRRIAKLAGAAVSAMYPSDGAFVDVAGGLVEAVKIDGVVVGVLRYGTGGALSAPTFQMVGVDAQGTVLSDADGTSRIASPFGDRDVQPAIAFALDYAAKGYDADLGLVRMGVRDYDPAIARFTTPDPLFLEHPDKCVGSPSECNLYGYAKNRPHIFTDPTGTCAEDLCIGEGAAAVGVGVYLGYAFIAAAGATYLSAPSTQRSLSVAIAAGSRAAGDALDDARKLGSDVMNAVTSATSAYLAMKAAALTARFGTDTRYVFATYTVRLADGSVYSGRTSGTANAGEADGDAANRVVAERWEAHHMRALAAPGASPTLDKYAAGKISAKPSPAELLKLAFDYAAVRGREQQLIDANGRSQSDVDASGNRGTSGNSIRGVAKDNPLGRFFDAASSGKFGPVVAPKGSP